MGANIPLPALAAQAPQQPDLLGNLAKLSALKSQAGQQQMQQQTMQENALEIQQKQRMMQDQQTIMQTVQAHGGDLMSALPELAGKVSAATFIPLQKSIVDTQKNYQEMNEKRLANEKASADQLLGLVGQAKQMDPQSYRQAWPQIAQKAVEIEPRLAKSVDQNQPIPQQSLDGLALGFATHSQLASIEQQKREVAAQQETVRHNQAMEGARSTEPVPLVKNGKLHSVLVDKTTGEEVKDLGETRQPNAATNLMTQSDAKDIADAIENGDQPPTLQGLYRNAGPVRAELARRGVPLAKMETDWKATQKYMGTLNGTQQTRLRQAISTASDSLDKIDSLYQEYHSIVGDAGMKVFNKAGLAASRNLPGRAGAVATALEAQIADVTSELGNVYMGGNSPTDHSLSLAGKNLSSDWNQQTFEEAIKQAHLNLKIRQNSILHAAPAGLSGQSNYYQPQEGAAPAAAQAETRTYQGHTYAKQADGSWKLQ